LKNENKLLPLTEEVQTEVERAESLFPSIRSLHEGFGVISEEFDEFKAEVWKLNLKKGRDTRAQAREELIQVAAMALRIIRDCDL